MKIQDLSIIFMIIIIPISIVLSVYTQFQIETLNLQTLYDTKLTSATYDAIKAFQINTANSTMSDLSNAKMRDIEASVATFRNSIMSTFGLNGYTEDELNNYIPALVYTLYDGLYIYSPYENTNYLYETEKHGGNVQFKTDGSGNKIPAYNNGETMYGLKPYITYSCRYKKGNLDLVITYSLDNYITIQGTDQSGRYVNDEGYLIDGIQSVGTDIQYNGITISSEQNLTENVGNVKQYPYIKINGTKYYYEDNNTSTVDDDSIFYLSNGQVMIQGDYKGLKAAQYYKDVIKNNSSAIKYYTKAMQFTDRVKAYGLGNLTYNDAYEVQPEKDSHGNLTGQYRELKLWDGDTRKIFVFNTDLTKPEKNIECELSNYNQHRLAVIRHKIEQNLSIAIANYNRYSQATGIQFQMPELKEEEWSNVVNNISLISFVQGLYIGGKIYNGYSIVNNSESKEMVAEENIFLLGKDNYYHRIGDNYLSIASNIPTNIPAGRLNLDFKRTSMMDSSTNTKTRYYYPMVNYASYNSIITQNDVTTYKDIYNYISQQNNQLKKSYYTALGREREGQYSFSSDSSFDYNVLIVGYTPNTVNYEHKLQNVTNYLNEQEGIQSTYMYIRQGDGNDLNNYLKSQKNNYKLIILYSFVWDTPVTSATLSELFASTNIVTIANDAGSYPIMETSQTISVSSTQKVGITSRGQQILQKTGLNLNVSQRGDSYQVAVKFKPNVEVLYKATYTAGAPGNWDAVGLLSEGGHNWIHSQICLDIDVPDELKLIGRFVECAMNGI